MKPLFTPTLGFLLIGILLLSFQCGKEPICTEEFRTIGVFVIGESLDEFYTIHESSGDTLHFEYDATNQNFYPVLDDSYKYYFTHSTETFLFYGIRNGQVVIEETFVIKADECHIDKVSGVESVVI